MWFTYHIAGNFRNLRNQTPAHKNLFSWKFLSQKFLADRLRKLSTLSSSHRSRNSTKNCLFCHRSSEQTAINLPVIIAAANGSSELVHFLWHGSFFAGSDLHAFVSMFEYTLSFLKGHHFHAGKLYGIKNCEIFSWRVCWCFMKIYARKIFSPYDIYQVLA